MQWEVSGADRQSGAERKIIVEADTEDSARRRASRQNLMVSNARAIDPNDSIVSPAITTASVAPSQRQNEEALIFSTRLHPLIVFFGPVLVLAVMIGIAVAIVMFVNGVAGQIVAGVSVFAGVAGILGGIIRYISSRFRVTTQRISIQQGILSRKSFELLLQKVESISIEQSIIERLLGCGTIIIHGTGGSREAFPGIKAARRFRESATGAIERYGRR